MTQPKEQGRKNPVSQALVELASETWKLDRTLDRCLMGMDPFDAERLSSQYGWYHRKVQAVLDEADLRVVDLTGQLYDVGMAVTPLNLDDLPLGQDVPCRIAQMVEPIVIEGGTVRREGTVMLQEDLEES